MTARQLAFEARYRKRQRNLETDLDRPPVTPVTMASQSDVQRCLPSFSQLPTAEAATNTNAMGVDQNLSSANSGQPYDQPEAVTNTGTFQSL